MGTELPKKEHKTPKEKQKILLNFSKFSKIYTNGHPSPKL